MGARKLEQLFLRCRHRDRFKGKLINFSGGQIANATVNNKSENFTWDGLSLLKRDATTYLNEPAITGGNPVAANGSVMFNDMLGTTQGTVKDGKYSATSSTLFGETSDKSVMFTGKPMIDGLGYSFLFRSYRPELAKWQTSDPLGYPDGFNNFAYVNNGVTNGVDPLGLWTEIDSLLRDYYYGGNGASLNTDALGITGLILTQIMNLGIIGRVEDQINEMLEGIIQSESNDSGFWFDSYTTSDAYDFSPATWSLGDGVVATSTFFEYEWFTSTIDSKKYRYIEWSGSLTIEYSDTYADPFEIGIEPGGTPYDYYHTWSNKPISGMAWIVME